MKKLVVILFSLGIFGEINAQDQSSIREGQTLEYNIFPNGGYVVGYITIQRISADTVSFDWSMRSLRGNRTMLKNSIETAKNGFWNPPTDGESIIIPDDQSFLFISKEKFSNLKKTGSMQFDGQLYKTESASARVQYKVGNIVLNAVQATNPENKTVLWILDNASFPLILKIENNPFNVDVELSGLQ